MNLSKNQVRVLIGSNVLCWVVILFMLASNFSKGNDKRFDVITAERINIVNEDGTTVIAIANKQRIANPQFDGVKYPNQLAGGREHLAGMIFFNQEGDEMGGLIFNSFKMPNGRVAGIGHLSFDRFKDNQVINLEYKENRSGVRSGLTIYDRPGDGSFPKSLALSNEYFFDESITEERKLEIKDTLNIMKQNNGLGSDRLFLGSYNEIPQLSMKDELGNERVKLFIDSSNVAKLHFFDEEGVLIDELPRD